MIRNRGIVNIVNLEDSEDNTAEEAILSVNEEHKNSKAKANEVNPEAEVTASEYQEEEA